MSVVPTRIIFECFHYRKKFSKSGGVLCVIVNIPAYFINSKMKNSQEKLK